MSSVLSRQLIVLKETCRALARIRGEEAAASLAHQVIRRYGALGPGEKADFFAFLIDEFSPDSNIIDHAITAYRSSPSPRSAQHLAEVAEAPRIPLLRSIHTAQSGMDTLLDMRADCMEAVRSRPEFVTVERDLTHLLSSWFNRGFLRLVRIDWQTPAQILEKLIEYEAVHEIRGWDDLRRRLERDRRCFGFFHPTLPGEPLVFVEVALTVGLPGSIHDVLDAPAPGEATLDVDTAVFYSITNCQPGLRGIPLGSFLLKQVTEELSANVPGLNRFSTLSPIPGYSRWVESTGGGLSREVAAAVTASAPAFDPSFEPDLMRSCARYLLTAKRRVLPRDPVARFHLRNGARLDRINWAGDLSAKGLGESFGMLVNYVYDPAELADNHDGYVNEFRVAHSDEVALLAD